MASGSKTVIYAALAGNSLIAITKFIAATLTGSSAMLSEGIHSTVDTGNQFLLLLGLRQACRAPDKRFPFGRGKEIYFYSFVVAISIFALGSGISLYEGIKHLSHPELPKNPMINYIVLGLSMIFEGVAWYMALREFNRVRGDQNLFTAVAKSKNPALFVVLFEDSAAMLGLLAAFFGVLLTQLTGNPVYDALASIAIGLVLAGTAAWLAYETHGLLIGESADEKMVADVRAMVGAHELIATVNECSTLHMGPEYILTTLSVDFIDESDSVQVEAAVADLTARIKTAHPLVKRVFIEVESSDTHTNPASC